jgi:hypothetical protein
MYNVGDKVKVYDQIVMIDEINHPDNIHPEKGNVIYMDECFVDFNGESRDWCYELEIEDKVGI